MGYEEPSFAAKMGLSPSAANVSLPEWQVEELARRKENLMANPASGLAWDAVKQRIRSRYGR